MEINKDVYFHIDRLNENIQFLEDVFKKHAMSWTLVCKLFDSFPSFIMNELSKKTIAKSIACEVVSLIAILLLAELRVLLFHLKLCVRLTYHRSPRCVLKHL